MINSALVSAQNRERLYWTNIPSIEQPWDCGILLKDIIENKPGDKVMVQGCADRNQVTKRGIEQQINIRRDFKANCVVPTYPNKLNMVAMCRQIGEADIKGKDSTRRVYSVDAKGPTLTAICGGHQEPKISQDGITWRKLTPLECERLQTLPDGYTEGISNSRRYHALGNGWTVDVICHILKGIMA
jgi:site-specific DNA-cytosine methylase